MANCHDDAHQFLHPLLGSPGAAEPTASQKAPTIVLLAVVRAFCELKPHNSRSGRPTLPPCVCQSENSVSGVGSSCSVWRQPLAPSLRCILWVADLQASVLVLGAKSVLVPAALASFLMFSSFRVSSSLTLSESVPWKPSGQVLFDCVQILFLYEDLQLSLSCKYMMCNYCIRHKYRCNCGGR